MVENKRTAPRSAFAFLAPMQFAAPAAPPAEPCIPAPPQPITILARSAQPIDHAFWGRVVHDMSGMRPAGDRIQLDWCHDCETNLGFLDKFEADQVKGLTVSGQVVPFDEDDKASEVLHKGRAGVPYQASIDWSGPGCLIEEVGAGVSVEVNGYTFEGPGVVVRQWPLTSVALCPYGYDADTNAKFSRGRELDPGGDIEVRTFSKEVRMSKDTTTQTAPSADDLRKQFAADLKRFSEKFGPTNGSKWLGENKTFAEALELHNEVLVGQVAERDAKIVELEKKLSAVKLGEPGGVSGSEGDASASDQGPGKKKFSGIIRMKK